MKLVIYRTRGLRGTGYRWTLIADNGRKLANGGQAYSRRIDMVRAVEHVINGQFSEDGTTVSRYDVSISGEVGSTGGFNAIPVEDRTR